MSNALEDLITPVCENLGYDVVRVRMQGGESRKTLQIMVERKDRAAMTVEDCAVVSRALSPVLDEKDPIESRYTLEVSSPGLDRPLVKLADFDRFKGFEAKVETSVCVAGRKRFPAARLIGVQEQNVVLDFEGTRVVIPFADIAKAKLILNDELIGAFAPSVKE